jgi:arginine exporter protein ArgO
LGKEKIVLKSRENRAAKIALILAVFIIIIILLVVFSTPNTTPITNRLTNFKTLLLIAGILALLYYMRKKRNPPTQYDIIKTIADEEYKHRGTLLDTSTTNIIVKQNTLMEYFVEFIREGIIYTYRVGVGVVESNPTQSISRRLENERQDKIRLLQAELDIKAQEKVRELKELGLLPEEEEYDKR